MVYVIFLFAKEGVKVVPFFGNDANEALEKTLTRFKYLDIEAYQVFGDSKLVLAGPGD